MENTAHRAIAIVGLGAILPDAPNVATFWNNVKSGRYSISEVQPDRWDPAAYYDADPSAPDKTYSKIGGWVREYTWDPMKWRLPIPPRVADAMDPAQKWGIACTRAAVEDYGYPKRSLDLNRTAVILGNAMAGERHYLTSMRVFFPEYARELAGTASFAALPATVRSEITEELHRRMGELLPEITEDSMPGELANCIAGRIANLYNFHGPNFVCDAACASAMAAISAAAEGLIENDFDIAVTGGIDRNMGAPTFVKFCKIGALSATGSRPFAEGADGFVMGEGAAIFLLKRLADAERDQDKIYAVLRGIGGASDGKGKGITAPNPVGQRLCVERAWQNAGLSPATATLIEGHGTSTRVGDVVEAQCMVDVLGSTSLPVHSVALGSVKSNIGHLKGAAGAAGMLKATLALHHKLLPPSLHCERPSPDIDFAHSPLYVNTELQDWKVPPDLPRRCGVSAFGFGGTNFHMVMEEYLPGKLNGHGKKSIAVPVTPPGLTTKPLPLQAGSSVPAGAAAPAAFASKVPLRGALVIGGDSDAAVTERLRVVQKAAQAGSAPAPAARAESGLRAPERLVIDYADPADLAIKCGIALKAFQANQAAFWKALRAQGIFRGHGPAPKVAFLYTGQGSQYVNMVRTLREKEPIVAATFAEADRVMTPLLGKPLSEFIFVDPLNADAVARAEEDLRQTAITQPAVLTIDIAMTRLLGAYGIRPDMTMGHSVGEYGALVASGALPFEDGLEAVSARGREMTRVSMEDNGKMAAVFAPIAEVERILKTVTGYVVIANVNSNSQSVIGGASRAVEQATQIFLQAGYNVVELPVSHAFHTSIVAPASEPLRQMLCRLHLQPPQIPIVANINGEFYPTGDVVPRMVDILAQQIAAPVQFVKGLRTLYDSGARVFVEVGPKKALQGFAEDVLGGDPDVFSLFTNHPKLEDLTAFNQALCGMYAAGLGGAVTEAARELDTRPIVTAEAIPVAPVASSAPQFPQPTNAADCPAVTVDVASAGASAERYAELGRLVAEALDRAGMKYGRDRGAEPAPVVITGAALGLPGTDHIFDDGNVARILRGDQFIDVIPSRFRRAMLDKRITRLVKSDSGGPVFESIGDVADVIKLAGRGGAFDLQSEFGVSDDRVAALDRVTCLAIASGIDAMRDAGIPLVMRYKTTTKGTQLPDRWGLPEALRDDTGVIFGSAFPGCDSFAEIISGYHLDHARREELARLQEWRARAANGHSVLGQEIARRIEELRAAIEQRPYIFDRRFLFRVLSMGHSQFAEYIGARGPNTQINAACATTAQAVTLAEDWIRAGRCSRVIVISADDVTSDNNIEWFGAGFLASGAAATDEVVEDAAIPFDKRRHGLIMGMGAAALVVESAEAARERGIQPICEVLSAVTANSAFHGSRLDVQHITQVMEEVISQAEKRHGILRRQIAPRTVFVSHETYTPARGGSASAEIFALRHVFGEAADQIVIANTKGFTGHAMATGIEEVLAVKALETGCVPPVPNFRDVDPELGELNLSKGGQYPAEYALRLGAGFGSQISMTLLRWTGNRDVARPSPNALGYSYRIVDPGAWNAWLNKIAGHPAAELEVVKRTLRVRDRGLAARVAESAQAAQPAAIPAPSVQPAPASVTAPIQQPLVATAVVQVPVIQVSPPASIPQSNVVATPSAVQVSGQEVVPPSPAPPAPSPEQKPLAVQPAPEGDPVRERVLALVSDKTGYPIDMLDLDLDMEADLGVDTVKQAEVFAAIRGAYGIERDDKLKLRDFPTLAHVIRFVHERRPDLTKAGAPQVAPVRTETRPKERLTPFAPPGAESSEQKVSPSPAIAPQPTPGDPVKERILALVVEKTGYPSDMLDLDLDLEADLGIDTVKQAEMFAAIRDIYNIPRDENRKLRDYPTLAHVIRFVYEKRPDLLATAPVPPAAASVPVTPALIPTTPQPLAAPAAAGESATKSAVAPTIEALPPQPAGDPVKDRILALVVEKTGYPRDMLDLDLDLEADLGIDTVKQAEMFAAIREIYTIPRDENRKLRDYPTLAHVIRFVYEMRPDLAGTRATEPAASVAAPARAAAEELPATIAPADTAAAPAIAAGDAVKQRILALVVEKTGYPSDMLDLDLDLEADLGVDTVKQAEMFAAIREIYNIPRDENRKLRDYPTLGHVIRFVYEMRPDLAGGTHPKTATTAQELAPAATLEPPVPAPSEAGAPEVTQVGAATIAVPASAASPTDEEIRDKVVEIVAEKTGYPKDMLDLDLDLEADLGIDTVKQAEMFASVRAAYNIPRDESLKLRDFPTLGHVIKFAQQRKPGAAAIAAVTAGKGAPSLAAPTPAVPKPRPPVLSFDAAERVPRRVPIAVLRPPLNICKLTGVTLAAGKRIVVMPDTGGVAEALLERLKASHVEALLINRALDNDALAAQINTWTAAGPVHGVYWLPALDNEGSLQQMDLTTWHAALQIRLKALYSTMRALYGQIAVAGTFLVSATRLGGQHGYDEAGAVAPLGGAVTGFAKAFKRERTDALVKTVDFESGREAGDIAQTLIDETLRDPGAVEIGYKDGLRWTVSVQEQPVADGQPGVTLDSNSVFLVTGAAGSIVSAIIGDLAAASGGTFYLLDLVPEPDPDSPDLKRFAGDKDGLRRDLFARIQARGERATPALVEKELAALERAQAAQAAIDAVGAAGGTAYYRSVNLTDSEAVASVIEQVRRRSGRIDVLLHAAGMERSHFLPDKDPREFNLVFDVKSDGWFNLLHAIGDMPLGATVVFSSVAGRFGNGGQTDYSSANDLLCKIISSFRSARRATRGIAIDWSAWGGIGMATRGSIPKMMELAGIDMLAPEAGIPWIRRELTSGGARGEVVVGQRLGILLKEWDSTGGLDTNTIPIPPDDQGPMVGKLTGMGIYSGLTMETTLDPKAQPFLYDHRMDGTPVLPGVMGIEAFAEAALCVHPGWHIDTIEEVNFLAPFKFYRDEPRTLMLEAIYRSQADRLVADCRLIGRRTLPNHPEPQETTHFTARVRLTRDLPEAAVGAPVGLTSDAIVDAAQIYRVYFHGPAYQVLEKAWWDGERMIGEMAQKLPSNHQPSARPTLMAPRLIELCFQTAGLWEMSAQGRFGLPQHVHQVRWSRSPESAEGRLYAVVTPHPEDGSFDAEVVDAKGNRYVRVGGYRTVSLPNGIDADVLKTLQRVFSAEAVMA
ncbi:MAG TPA: SDR family NAD(P)-dependent oxidoreductase [Candidatus Binatia bacterium]|nr:SDR family NAD(P)-dependent oxidoreductase [Candidatus Binatia bacterium]